MFEKSQEGDTTLDENGQSWHWQLPGRLLWLELSTHVGTATLRDEATVKRLLRYVVGDPLCKTIQGCTLDVLAAAGTPLGSVLVMTDADGAGDVKDRKTHSGTAVWVQSTTKEIWYPVYASSEKHSTICLSSREPELMALVGGACEGIATRDHWSKMCGCANGTTVLCTDTSAALGFVKSKGASRHVDTNIYFMQAWAMEPGQRMLQVHVDSQQIALSHVDHDASSWTHPGKRTLGTMRSTPPITTSQWHSVWRWNGATAISGTCQFAMLLAPIRRAFVTPIYSSVVGLIQNDLGTVRYEYEVRAAWTTRAPARPWS